MIGNENQRLEESMTLATRAICWATREIDALREKARVVEDNVRHNSRGWVVLNAQIQEQETMLEEGVARARMLAQKVRKCKLVEREQVRLERLLLCTQAEAKALEDEAKTPVCVHRWIVLGRASPEVANLLAMRTQVLDRLNVLLAKTTRLKVQREALKKAIDRETLLAGMRGVHDCRETMRACEVQLRTKTLQLATLMREADEEKGKGDEWLAKIGTARAEIVEEKEQFFSTKWKEAEVVSLFHPVREPPVMEFVGGQAHRPMIPHLRLTGMRSRPSFSGSFTGLGSARVSNPGAAHVLPALQAIETGQ
jgi:hypothetical protein